MRTIGPITVTTSEAVMRALRLCKIGGSPDHPLCERFEVRIDDPVRDQRDPRALEVIGRRAECAARGGDDVRLLRERQAPRVLRMISPDDKGERDELAAVGFEAHPPRAVRADDHLAPPQQMQFVERRGREAQRNAAAVPPGQAQHGAGCSGVPRVATDRTETPMETAQHRRPHFLTGTAGSTGASRRRNPARALRRCASVEVSESDSCSSLSACPASTAAR
jgi:hypothetical protein